MFEFQVTGKLAGRGRTGILHTPHGLIHTPIFMPVGTAATVKSLTNDQIKSVGSQIILANNYHLYLRPGSENIASLGGIHRFMNLDLPILTDSGGFQVWSLGKNAKINPEGVTFKSHLDGTSHFFTPQVAIQSQIQIGADIIMAFDQCTNDKATLSETQAALNLTQDWLLKSIATWRQHSHHQKQALFGIIQGALHKDLRRAATSFVVEQDLPGIAIGGETIGYNMTGTIEVLDWIYDLLPDHKPRYTMGLGAKPSDIVNAVLAGVDMFDCVAPTRLARNGSLFVGKLEYSTDGVPRFVSPSANERINIGNLMYAKDESPVDPNCDCYTCQNHTKAYLNHLFKSDELLYNTLASLHNLRMMVRTALLLQTSK